ncbi:MAG TPA: membrane protein insertase YidC [Pseudolabrys sp.]|jgi:YidC/Oxa1 family membrane protein insertase|nr:membrane protein insertase YidC [Pseudolabrys sp.]
MTDNKNTILAIVLSALVLLGWQYFFAVPQEKARQEQLQAQQQKQNVPAPDQPKQAQSQAQSQVPGQASAPSSATPVDRRAALANSPRVPIATDTLQGTIALKGGRIDDLALVKFRETVDPKSPPIVLLSPSGTTDPFYAEFGWTGSTGTNVKLPTSETVWRQQGAGALSVSHPITLTYDNGEGLEFRRTISVDDKYLFTIKDEVTNKGGSPVTLFPYALISRHGIPQTAGYYVLHEGLIGVLGESGLQEFTYKNIEDKKSINFDVTNGWLGITDKYWAATLLPDTTARLKARFSTSMLGTVRTFQTDYLLDAQTIAPGATASVNGRLFAGAKEVSIVGINFPFVGIGGYNKELGLNHFDLLIDWGWFYFITKPMFLAMDFFFRLFGNFGLAILMVTVLVKIIFFPLANKSYASMAKMKAVQPQMMALRERFANDKAKQQQELMELYKREKINPLAGCLPIAIQIPVFFSLYKVLFVTIEMRHAPFFGWIHDLSAQDPTNLFNLFGLIPVDPTVLPLIGQFLHMGIWPLIMGITMWFQMKLNPAPPDPTQAMIFNWMPLIFTFMLASFPAGLVIYWAWNNLLSVVQQSVIMRKHGAKIELFDNIKAMFVKKTPQQ